jgi:sugar phosphate isomerase/epimerase
VLRDFVPKYHLHWVELRDLQFNGRNVYLSTAGTDAEVRHVKEQMERAHVRLSMLDTGIYKIPLPGTTPLGENAADLNKVQAHYHEQLDQLKHAAHVAHTLGTRKIRIFTFNRIANPDSVFNRVVDEVHKALEVAQQEDVELVVENEFDTNIATADETVRFFKAIPNRRLMHNWDPGNNFAIGDTPFPNTWDQLDHSRIVHMHLKDAVWLPGHKLKWMPVGGGKIDFVGQFRALKKMNFQGTISMETHYRNAANDRWTSTEESMDGLLKVLREA